MDYYSIPWTTIRSIVIDPIEPNILYAADFHLGVYMSTDGGITWDPINDGLSTKAVIAMALSSDGRVLYAATDLWGSVFGALLGGVFLIPILGVLNTCLVIAMLNCVTFIFLLTVSKVSPITRG